MTDNKSTQSSLRADLVSGFLVFLIALPLCLAISAASGFPPVAGVLTAIVGGVFISHMGSAELTIKGPAAGLIVITLGSVQELGMGDAMVGYHRTLAVGVVAAVIQIIFACLRTGSLAVIMPPTIVHGMLAAIGVTIIAKQTPVLVGFEGASGKTFEMLMEIPHYVLHSNPAIFLIGALSLIILIVLPLIPWKKLQKVPPPLIVLLTAIPLALAFNLTQESDYVFAEQSYDLGPSFLVQLPGYLWEALTFPDFSDIGSVTSIKYIVMFSLVGSIESLLSVLAVDSMDPAKRQSNLNRDLLVTGIGNLICAFIGGLPMISEIVRSRANIDAGAQSRWSNFFHGLSLLLFVALLPGVLQLIPLAALAAMLVVTGARLGSPAEFKHAWKLGRDQFLLFTSTFFVTLATDLLVGVAVGLLVKLVLDLVRGASFTTLFKKPFSMDVLEGHTLVVKLNGPVTFTNLLYLRRVLQEEISSEIKTVKLNFEGASLVDHTTLKMIFDRADELENTTLELVGLDAMNSSSKHPQSTRRQSLSS